MAKKLGIQTKGTGRAALQGGGVPPVAGAGGMAPVGGAARRDMRSGYYPSDMGMRGGPMYNKGGRVGLRDRAFKKGGKVNPGTEGGGKAKKKPTHKPVKGTFKRKKGIKPGSLEYWQHSVQTPKRKGGKVNTSRENRLEELGRVDAERGRTRRGKRNLREEKDRIRGELGKRRKFGRSKK